ncbi:MAG TPA: hypothetical protein VEP50_12865 [bacterium]|nr:hypothetical protein [bacterium]
MRKQENSSNRRAPDRLSRRALVGRVPRLTLGALLLSQVGGSPPPGDAAPASGQASAALRRVATLDTPQGFGGPCAFTSTAGKTVLVMANGESAYMNQLAFDVASPEAPRLLARAAGFPYLWGVAAAGDLAVFASSVNPGIGAYRSTTLAPIWQRSLPATTHSVATDGTNVFLAQEGTSNLLVLNGRSGATLGTAALPSRGVFGKIYATVYHGGRVYVGDPSLGVVVFNVTAPASPAYATRFGRGTSNIAVNGTRAWVVPTSFGGGGNTLECWDLSKPAAPSRVGTYSLPATRENGNPVRPTLFMPAINTDGTRLYVVFVDLAENGNDSVWNASGFYLFNVSGDTPLPINRFSYQIPPTNGYPYPVGIATDAGGKVIALTSYYYGVQIWQARESDQWVLASKVPTVGECRDVHVDAAGNQIALGRWVVTSKTADGRISYYNEVGYLFEGWRAYTQGTILVMDPLSSGGFPRVYSVAAGQLTPLGTLKLSGGIVTDAAYDGSGYVYVCSGSSGFTAGRVGSGGRTNVTQLGTAPVYPERVALNGRTQAWVVSPKEGVACVDISNPSSMSVVARDPQPFTENGMCDICVTAGRAYAACGSGGIRIYNPATLKWTAVIAADPRSGKIFPTWVEPFTSPTTGKSYLIVCHYGDGLSYNPPEGLRIYSLTDPDAPALVADYPVDGDANFRCRFANGYIYRCALWGVEQLALSAAW